MPIPAFNQLGLLPEGIHDCDLMEAQTRFGSFQGSDRRPQLWGKFLDFVRLAKMDRFIEELFIDGSFVTAKPDPNDMDVIVIVPVGHDFGADLAQHQYELLAAPRVRRRFGFDIVVVKPSPCSRADEFQRKGAKTRRRKEEFAPACSGHQKVSVGQEANVASHPCVLASSRLCVKSELHRYG